MSNSIDERIVQMQFDNKKFEDGVAESLKTLDKLKNATDFKASTKSFTDLESAAKKLSFGNLEAGVKSLTDRFSTLGIVGMTALQNITNKAVDAGERLVKSLTIDQVTTGWDKYADKTSAVQTIMAATAKDFDDTGKQMEYVNDQLDKLNWFTDETSYNFLDMVSNIGKFTSNAVDLETSVTAMQGISTWAAISGANANEASRAMYNLAQAIAVGEVKLIDWKSIENANMATAEFKETVIETALELGTLTKEADGTIKTLSGKEVSISDFNSQLSQGWFSSDVLLRTLDKYGSFADKLYEVNEKTGTTATEFLGYIEDYQNGTLDLAKTANRLRMSSDDLEKTLSELSSDTYNLGLRSFKAAQEAKTFGEAISSVKDAVSTGWMNTFEQIFGNYEEAKVLWTDLANGLYDVFASGGEERNLLLKQWRAIERVVEDTGKGLIVYEDGAKAIGTLGAEVQTLDGRTFLIEGVTNALQALVNVGSAVKYAFQEIFPPITASRLFDLTVQFRDFTEKIKNAFHFVHELTSEEVRNGNQVTILHGEILEMSKPMEYLVRILKGVFAAGKIVVDVFKMIGRSIGTFIKSNLPVFDSIGSFFAGIGDRIVEFKDRFEASDLYNSGFVEFVQVLGESINDFFTKDVSGEGKFIDRLKARLSSFTSVFDWLKNRFKNIQINFSNFGDVLRTIFNPITSIFDFFKGIFVKISGYISEKFTLQNVVALINSALGITALANLVRTLRNAGSFGKQIRKGLESIGEGIGNIFSGKSIFSASRQTFADKMLKVAIALGVLSAAVTLLASNDPEKLKGAMISLGLLASGLLIFAGALVGLDKFTGKESSLKKSSAGLVKISAALLILSGAVRLLSGVDLSTTGVLGIILAELLGFSILMSKFASNNKIKTAPLLALSASLVVISFALKKFSGMSWEDIGKGLAGIGGVLAELALTMIVLTRLTRDNTASQVGTLLSLAGSLSIIADSLIKLSVLSWEDIGKGLAGIGGVLGELAIAVVAMNRLGKGKTSFITLLGLAGSIVILSNVLKDISKLSWEEIGKGLAGVGGALLEISIATGIVSRVGKSGIGSVLTVIGLSVSLVILSNVLKDISKLSWEEIGKGLAGVGGALLELVFAEALLSKFGKSGIRSSITLIGLSAGLLVAANVLKDISKLSWEEIGKGLVAMVGMMALLTTFVAGLSFVSKNSLGIKMLIPVLLSLLALAVSMWVFVKAVKALGDYNGPDILRSMEAFALMVGSIGFITAGMGLAVSKIGFGNTILGGLALALSELMQVGMVALLGVINDWTNGGLAEKIESGGEVIRKTADALSVFTEDSNGLFAVVSLIGAGVIGATGTGGYILLGELVMALSALGAVITVDLAGVINDYFTGDSNVSMIDKGAEVLGKTAEALKNFIGASDIENPYEGWSYAGTQLGILVGSVFDLATQLVADIGALVGTTILGLIGSSSGWLKNIERGKAAVTSMGNAIGSFAGAMQGSYQGQHLESFSEHLPAFGDNLNAFTSGLKPFDESLVNNARNVGSTFAELEKSLAPEGGVWQFLTGEQNLGSFGERLATFGTKLNEFGTSLSPTNNKLIGDVITRVSELLDLADRFSTMAYSDEELWSFTDGLTEISQTGFGNFIAGLSDEDGQAATAGTDIATSFITALEEALSDIKTKGENVIKDLVSGITSQGTRLVTISTSIGTVVINSVSNGLSGMYQIGANASQGFLNGLSSKMDAIRRAAEKIGNTTVAATQKALDEHSPSRRMYDAADLGVQGYVNALHDGLSSVSYASEAIGDRSVLSLSEALSQLSALIENDMDVQPTITPVFDMSNLGQATDQLDNAFYMNKSLNLAQTGAFARNAEAVSDLNFKMGSTSSNAAVVDAVNNLGSRVDALNEAVTNMKIVLDTGAFVGGIAPTMDRALGQRANYKGRGN